jgi:hypothetical protein
VTALLLLLLLLLLLHTQLNLLLFFDYLLFSHLFYMPYLDLLSLILITL